MEVQTWTMEMQAWTMEMQRTIHKTGNPILYVSCFMLKISLFFCRYLIYDSNICYICGIVTAVTVMNITIKVYRYEIF